MEYLKVAGKDQLFWNQPVLFLLNRWIRTNTADAKALSQIKVASLDLQTLHSYIPAWASTPNCSGFVRFFLGPQASSGAGCHEYRSWSQSLLATGERPLLGLAPPGCFTKSFEGDPCWPLLTLVCPCLSLFVLVCPCLSLFVLVCPCLQSTCSTASCWTPGPVTMESCSDLAKKDLSTNVAMGHSWVPPNEMVYRNKLLRLELWPVPRWPLIPSQHLFKGWSASGQLASKKRRTG